MRKGRAIGDRRRVRVDAMPDRPNILLITTDTQRCDTRACLGNPHAFSPNPDRLAREGVLFHNAHASSPVCGPTRSSILTGVHTPIQGAIEHGVRRRTDLTVFPDLLREAGYANTLVGEAHFEPVSDSFAVRVVVAEKHADVDDAYGRHLRRHGYARPSDHPNPIPEDLFMEAFLVDTTIREIDRAVQEGRGPFFAFCSMVSPHGLLDPSGRWAELYRDRPLPPLNYHPGEIPRQPAHLREVLGLVGEEGAPRY